MKLITIQDKKTKLITAEIIGNYTVLKDSTSNNLDDNVLIRIYDYDRQAHPIYTYTGEKDYSIIDYKDSKYFHQACTCAETMHKLANMDDEVEVDNE